MSPRPELTCRKCGEPKTYMKSWKSPRLACLPCMDRSSKDRLGRTPEVRIANCLHCGALKTLSEYKVRKVWECLPCARVASIVNRYGVERDEALALSLIKACQSCGGQSVDARGLHVDHDHDSGNVRGVLCDRCNKALGLLDDDSDKIMALATYIKERS